MFGIASALACREQSCTKETDAKVCHVVGHVLFALISGWGCDDLQEADFGVPLADVNYFHSLANRKPPERVFVCIPGLE